MVASDIIQHQTGVSPIAVMSEALYLCFSLSGLTWIIVTCIEYMYGSHSFWILLGNQGLHS